MGLFKFFSKIVSQVVFGIFHYTHDNHDFSRFPKLEKSTESKFISCKNKTRDFVLWFINTTYFLIFMPKFFKSYQLLRDEKSKKIYIQLIIYKILGPKHVKINNKMDWSVEKKFLATVNQFYMAPSKTTLGNHSIFGKLNHYHNIPTENGTIKLDCWAGGIIYPSIKKQYYFSRDGISIKPEPGDTVIDGGGCFGDTSIFFAKSVGTNGKVYVFDPLPIHGTVIQKNILQNNLEDHVIYFPYAIGKTSNTTLPIQNSDHVINPGFRLTDNASFPIMSIDDFVRKNKINKIDFIKMDIEGYELLALKGAIETIKTFMPKLAISIYHRREDFFAIPLWLNQITNGYDFYIDHYTMHAEETVLYATPKQ